MQTYCILKADERGSAMRDVLFRFGSWCYTGKVELVPRLALEDLPYIIPALRVQHSKMKFLCDVRWLPRSNHFTSALFDAARISSLMEKEVMKHEQVLASLNELMILPSRTNNSEDGTISSSDLPQTTGILDWLDRQRTIFEFHVAPDKVSKKIYSNIDIIATKKYNPCGVISISIYCAGKFYLTLSDLQGKEQRLLDSRFPNVAAKGKGFKLHSYPKGVDDWPQLRNLSIWESVNCSGDNSSSFEMTEDEADEKSPHRVSEEALGEVMDPTHSSQRRSGIIEFSEASPACQIVDICPSCNSMEGWKSSKVYNREEEDAGDITVSDAPETDEIVKEKYLYGKKSRNKFDLRQDTKSIAAAKFPRIPNDGKTTDSATGEGAVVDEDDRSPKKKENSIARANSTSIKKAKSNLGAFHYLAPLSRCTSENRITLIELQQQHKLSIGENNEPWDSDGRPK